VTISTVNQAAARLVAWFKKNAEPWFFRETKDPYQVWVLEVMAQQTQLPRAVSYLERWLHVFPDLKSLASAPEEKVLKLWEGLGYYSRARNLQKAARLICDQFNGIFPDTAKNIQTLPGVGPYTAAAVASIVYGEASPAIDANVRRVMSRLHLIQGPSLSKTFEAVIIKEMDLLFQGQNPGIINEALMELGEKICKNKTPLCRDCPLNEDCLAFNQQKTDCFPEPNKKQVSIKQKYAVFIIKNRDEKFYIYRNTKSSLWKNLWQLPRLLMEDGQRMDDGDSIRRMLKTLSAETGLESEVKKIFPPVSHAYTKYRLSFFPVLCSIETESDVKKDTCWIDMDTLSDFAFPSGMLKVINKVFGK